MLLPKTPEARFESKNSPNMQIQPTRLRPPPTRSPQPSSRLYSLIQCSRFPFITNSDCLTHRTPMDLAGTLPEDTAEPLPRVEFRHLFECPTLKIPHTSWRSATRIRCLTPDAGPRLTGGRHPLISVGSHKTHRQLKSSRPVAQLLTRLRILIIQTAAAVACGTGMAT